jgi:hypothetical protein
MFPPPTSELQRQLHDDHAARLRSLHRSPSVAPRRVLGAWLVSAGLWLAPDERAQRDSPAPSLQTLP